jgi:hypothetical protein
MPRSRLALAFGLLLFGAFWACSSNDPSGPASPDGGASGESSGSVTSGGASSSGASGTGASGASGSSSSSSSGASSSSSSSGGAAGAICRPGDGDMCTCVATAGATDGTPCNKTTISDPGACCADPSWPQTGWCICSSFLCYVNSGGGKDCQYTDRGANGLEVPSTSATGAVCCLRGTPSIGYLCSCFDANNAGSCDGEAKVAACTVDALPPCKGAVENGYTPVTACR